jgi:ABC-type multidrug transport system ATPase subunit
MAAVIEVEELRKRYGGLTAVDGVSFRVAEREVFGIVGPNGAGKTTTVEIVEGLRRPDGGRVRVLGLDPGRDGPGLRQQIGAQLQKAALPDRLKVWEALDLYASFYDRPVAWPELVRAVRDAGATVVLVTHLMEEAERLCDRVAVIDRGRLVALAPTPRVAEAAGLVGFFPMIFLSGAVVPRESLSEGMRRIGEVLPLTPVVDGLRAAWDGSGPGLLTLAALAAILMVATAVAARTFRWE